MAIVIDTAQLTTLITAIVSVGATSAVWAWKYGKRIGPLLRTLAQFGEDWNGVDARPGYARRPGVAERIYSVEQTSAAQGEALEMIRRELVANGGGSLRDQIRRIEQAQRAVQTAVGAEPPLPLPAAELAALAIASERRAVS